MEVSKDSAKRKKRQERIPNGVRTSCKDIQEALHSEGISQEHGSIKKRLRGNKSISGHAEIAGTRQVLPSCLEASLDEIQREGTCRKTEKCQSRLKAEAENTEKIEKIISSSLSWIELMVKNETGINLYVDLDFGESMDWIWEKIDEPMLCCSEATGEGQKHCVSTPPHFRISELVRYIDL